MEMQKSSPWTAEDQIRSKVQMVVKDGTSFGILSTGERIAVAMVLNRKDLLDRAWGTILECVHRLGPEWTDAALRVQRDWVFDENRDDGVVADMPHG